MVKLQDSQFPGVSVWQHVLWLVWGNVCTTWPASGWPLEPKNSNHQLFSGDMHSALSFIQLPIFHKACRNFLSLWLLALLWEVWKLINRFKCWGGRQKWQRDRETQFLSNKLYFLRLRGMSSFQLCFLHCKFGTLLQEVLIAHTISSVMCWTLGNFFSASHPEWSWGMGAVTFFLNGSCRRSRVEQIELKVPVWQSMPESLPVQTHQFL